MKSLLREEAIKKLGSKCATCGFSDVRALQIDHIGAGGADERRALGRFYAKEICTRILRGATHYQLLCANCNVIKFHMNKEWKISKSAKAARRETKELRRPLRYDRNGCPID